MEIDFFSIFYPFFPDLCHFIQLWKITPFFYNNFFGFGGGGKLPLPFPPPCGRPWVAPKDFASKGILDGVDIIGKFRKFTENFLNACKTV